MMVEDDTPVSSERLVKNFTDFLTGPTHVIDPDPGLQQQLRGLEDLIEKSGGIGDQLRAIADCSQQEPCKHIKIVRSAHGVTCGSIPIGTGGCRWVIVIPVK